MNAHKHHAELEFSFEATTYSELDSVLNYFYRYSLNIHSAVGDLDKRWLQLSSTRPTIIIEYALAREWNGLGDTSGVIISDWRDERGDQMFFAQRRDGAV